jgi:UDPglucose 6-dehydrogenase
MKIIIAGYGFVGKAVDNAFKQKHTTVVVDPKYTTTKIQQHPDADGIVVCVNSPTRSNGTLDVEDLFDVLDQVPTSMPVLIKTTLTPSIADAIEKSFPELDITFNPEFLRQAFANDDFLNQTHAIFGCKTYSDFWSVLFMETLPNCNHIVNCTAKEACMVKYSANSFLSLKTTFFNQIYDICKADAMHFEMIRHILSTDPRIGPGHTLVPGPDGTRGFGGACFPKDTKAFRKYAHGLNKPITVLDSAIEYNETVRKGIDL